MSEEECDKSKDSLKEANFEYEDGLDIKKKYPEKFVESPVFPAIPQPNQFPSFA